MMEQIHNNTVFFKMIIYPLDIVAAFSALFSAGAVNKELGADRLFRGLHQALTVHSLHYVFDAFVVEIALVKE